MLEIEENGHVMGHPNFISMLVTLYMWQDAFKGYWGNYIFLSMNYQSLLICPYELIPSPEKSIEVPEHQVAFGVVRRPFTQCSGISGCIWYPVL